MAGMGDRRLVRVLLGFGMAVASTVVIGSQQVQAAEPSDIGGTIWSDLDGDGLRTADEPGRDGTQVSVVENDTGVLVQGPLTTGPDGSYLFSGLAAGEYRVLASTPQNQWISPSTAENLVAPTGAGGAPTSTGSSSNIVLDGTNRSLAVNAAVRPRPELSLGTFGPGVLDGGPDFNTTGNCATPMPNPTPTGAPEWLDAAAPGQTPGDDCGSSNGVVRTQDSVVTIWSVTADNYEPGAPDLSAVVFEQIIHPSGGALVDFTRIPVSCLPAPAGSGGATPASTVTYDDPAPGDVKLTCNLGSFTEGFQESITTFLHVSGESTNGSSFTSDQRVYSVDPAGNVNAIGDSADPVGPTSISAAPAYDLAKDTIGILNYGSETRDMAFDDHLPLCETNPQPCNIGPERGRYGYFLISLSTDAKTGIEAIAQPVTIDDQFFATSDTPAVGSTYAFDFEITECRWNPSGWGNAVYGRWVDNQSSAWYGASVLDSGTCDPQRADDTDPTSSYDLVLDDIDMSGTEYPTKRYGGADLSAGPYFVSMHRVRFFIPTRTIDLSDGVADGVGSIQVSNCLDNFDPDSVSGVSNFGPATEPGFNRSIMTGGAGSNNCAGPTSFDIVTRGSFSKYNYGYISTSGSTAQNSGNTSHSGAHTYEPGQSFPAVVWNTNNGTNDLLDSRSCDVFDNTSLRLNTSESVGQNGWKPGYLPTESYAYVNDHDRWNQHNDPADFVVEYASAEFGTDDPLNGGFNPVSSRHEGDWSIARQFNCDDNATVTEGSDTFGLATPNAGADLDGDGWTTDPTAFVGGLDAVNMVRARFVDETIPMEPGDRLALVVPLQLRDSFNGGPHSGEEIPAGTVMPNFGSARWDHYSVGQWSARRYQPSPETGYTDGDRVTLTRAQLRLQKHTLVPETLVGNNGATLAGNQIVWELIPTLTSAISAPAPVQALTVVDILPSTATYNAACTSDRPDGTPPALVEFNQPNPGETQLTWFLGEWTPNTDVPRLVVCTDSDPLAPNGTAVLNQASATASGVAYNAAVQTDSHTIILEQAGSIQLSKSVDLTLDDQNDDQVYALAWTNFAPAFLIQKPTIIDVFPYNGDGLGAPSERDPESSFHGDLALMAAPVATFTDGSVPGFGDPFTAIGLWTYSSDAPNTIDHNPDENTSNWCLEANFGLPGCPGSFADATAIKFVSNYDLARDGNPRQGVVATYVMQAGDPSPTPDPAKENQPGDRYTNRFALDTASLEADQYLRSNNVSVVVAAYSIGDLIFVDVDGNGSYDSASDQLAPDGVIVQLRRAVDDSLVASTMTNQDGIGAGRYLFGLLASGGYYINIPAGQFVGGPLQDWVVTDIPVGATEGDDANENTDQHGFTSGLVTVDGVRTNTLRLSATPPLPGGVPLGDEPLADNLGGINDVTNDDFSNLTLDIGLIGPADIQIDKQVCTQVPASGCDEDDDSHWVESAEVGYFEDAVFRIVVTNTGLQTLRNVVTSDVLVDDCARTNVDHVELVELAPTESFAYTCSASQVLSAFTNTAAVQATPVTGPDPTDTDTASVTLATAQPAIEVQKATNTVDADQAPGVFVNAGGPVTWTYVVTNSGNMPLREVLLTDDMGTPANLADDRVMSNLSSEFVGGDTDGDDLLDLGESWTFSLTGTATAGQYTNIAEVRGKALVAGIPDVDDVDPSNYFGVDPGTNVDIKVEKATNAGDPLNPWNREDADFGTGPLVGSGSQVVWTYLVRTDGAPVPLANVRVVDDAGTPATAGDDLNPTYMSGDDGNGLLEPGEVWLFSQAGVAIAGQYENHALAYGTTPATTNPDGSETLGAEREATDLSHYFGVSPAVSIIKRVNGQDANSAPGVSVEVASTVAFTYDVQNTGDTVLVDLVVSDDQRVEVSCPSDVLFVGESMRCTGTAAAVAGSYVNIGDVVGTPAEAIWNGTLSPIRNGDGALLPTVADDDPAHYFGSVAGVQITKFVEGHDANNAPGVALTPGELVNFTYDVTNTGALPLMNVAVADDQGVIVTCPGDSLEVGQSMTCTGAATAAVGQYTNIGDVAASPAIVGAGGELEFVLDGDGNATVLQDSDPANYFGAAPDVDIVKYVEGHDANDEPGVTIENQSSVRWTHVVTNTGTTWLGDLTVADDQGVVVTCPETVLAPGESMTCTGDGVVELGPYRNIGVVTGVPMAEGEGGELAVLVDTNGAELGTVGDDDPANNFGYANGIELTKYVFGHDAPVDEAVRIAADEIANFTYEVTNTGNTWLANLTIEDDQGVAVSCPVAELAPGATAICSGEGLVPAGEYRNIATASGQPSVSGVMGLIPVIDIETGSAVPVEQANDDANLFGEAPALAFDKVACVDDDCSEGLRVEANTMLTWRISVTNTGNVELHDVQIVDDLVSRCDRDIDVLAVQETVIVECRASVSDVHENTAEVTATPTTGIVSVGDVPMVGVQTSLVAEDTATVQVLRRTTTSLPHTGSTTSSLAGAGIGLVCLGWFLVGGSRRKQRQNSSAT